MNNGEGAVMQTRCVTGNGGFTLIELLVVMAIILILGGMSFVGVHKINASAARTKAKVQVKQLEKALQAYYDEYGEWPKNMTSYDADPREGSLTGIEVEERLVKMLSGEPVTVNGETYNRKRIKFMPKVTMMMSADGSYSKKGYLDPWKHCYKYMCDFNDDGILLIQFSNASGSGDKSVRVSGQGVGVWSRGPDGIDAPRGDDVTSWKTQ